jgi:hypothetical protein
MCTVSLGYLLVLPEFLFAALLYNFFLRPKKHKNWMRSSSANDAAFTQEFEKEKRSDSGATKSSSPSVATISRERDRASVSKPTLPTPMRKLIHLPPTSSAITSVDSEGSCGSNPTEPVIRNEGKAPAHPLPINVTRGSNAQ